MSGGIATASFIDLKSIAPLGNAITAALWISSSVVLKRVGALDDWKKFPSHFYAPIVSYIARWTRVLAEGRGHKLGPTGASIINKKKIPPFLPLKS